MAGAADVGVSGSAITQQDTLDSFTEAMLLLLVTPSRKGEERELMEEAITRGEFVYDPHARETALRAPERQDE